MIRPLGAMIVMLLLSAAAPADEVSAVVAFPNLRFERPLYFGSVPGSEGDAVELLVVVEQDGLVHALPNDAGVTRTTIALDIRGQVYRGNNEEGLLGLAFHRDFTRNRGVFLCYSASNPRRNVLSRWTAHVTEETITIDPDSEQVILEVGQPWGNHNGGGIEFGPDGYLYYTLGDGGAAGDPRNVAQDKRSLLGKILRLDVDKRDPGLAYAIPRDNPFAHEPGARGEIWAYGLRNVWRFSFDRLTGDLWAGDVGQNTREEVNLIVKGGNYGWRVREGKLPFNPDPNNPGPFIEPIVDHPRREAWSVTGGYVYRGAAIPALVGAYVYGDFGSGLIWALRYDPRKQEVTEHKVIGKVPAIASFGEDRAGELYLCSFDGRIYRLVPEARRLHPPESPPPR